MELVRVLGLTTVYILILLIQIITLIIVAKKNEKSKWKRLFVFETVILIIALVLSCVFWVIVFDDKDFLEDFVWHLWNMYGSIGATVVYGMIFAVSIIVRITRHNKCENKQ